MSEYKNKQAAELLTQQPFVDLSDFKLREEQ